MRAWCWTLPVKIIEVNVSVNWVLNLELHFEGFWKGTLSQNSKTKLAWAVLYLNHYVAPIARRCRKSRNVALVRTGKACMES